MTIRTYFWPYTICLIAILLGLSCCKDDEPDIVDPTPPPSDVFFKNLQNLELGLAPLVVYGDLNWDLKVDEKDKALLIEWVSMSGGVISAPDICPAAGDLNQDGKISEGDLDLISEILKYGAVTRPGLTTHGELGCDYNHAFLAGPTYALAGDSVSLRLLTDTIPQAFIELWTEGPVDEIRPVEGNRGWDIFLSDNADPTDTLRIHIDLQGKGSFIYRVRILDKINDMTEGGAPPVFEEPPSDTLKDCPHRGKGTEALIVDMRLSTFEPSAHKIKIAMEKAGISVTYLAPHFRSLTHEVDMGFIASIKSVFSGNEVLEKEIEDHNKKEANKLMEGIETYANRIHKGCETAIEIIWAHGSYQDNENGFPCGSFVSPFYNLGYPREKFHRIMYKGTDQRVCNHIVADYSCFSGLTPMGVDELNNTGFVTCTRNLTNQPIFRPAYDMTLAVGAAKPDDVASFSEADNFRDTWYVTIISATSNEQLPDLLQQRIRYLGKSTYEDQGIHEINAKRKGY